MTPASPTGGRPRESQPDPSPPGRARLADEVEVLRWCMTWLERLEQADHVVVNLRPARAEATAFVPFDRPRVLRVLARIAADLDELARPPGPRRRRRQCNRKPPMPGTSPTGGTRATPATAEPTGRACGIAPSSWASALYATLNRLWRCCSQN